MPLFMPYRAEANANDTELWYHYDIDYGMEEVGVSTARSRLRLCQYGTET